MEETNSIGGEKMETRGRPRKPESLRKTVRIPVYLTESQRAELMAKAREENKDLSTFLRESAFEYFRLNLNKKEAI